jgi:hypothetical protein
MGQQIFEIIMRTIFPANAQTNIFTHLFMDQKDFNLHIQYMDASSDMFIINKIRNKLYSLHQDFVTWIPNKH